MSPTTTARLRPRPDQGTARGFGPGRYLMQNEFQKRIGVGERQHRYGRHANTSRDLMVLDQHSGEVGGKHTEHWDGRQDATVFAPTTKVSTTATELRS